MLACRAVMHGNALNRALVRRHWFAALLRHLADAERVRMKVRQPPPPRRSGPVGVGAPASALICTWHGAMAGQLVTRRIARVATQSGAPVPRSILCNNMGT